ncbi:MAG: SOS response-associated peptidase [Sediminibacterium sp.]
MCYVVGVKIPKKQTIIISDQTIELDPIELPAQSGFSYAQWPVIFNEQQAQNNILRPGLMHWELIPNWVRNQKELNESRKKYTTLNIKSEGILQNKVTQALVHTNRCLVLASHFFEWQEMNKEKFPHCIQLKHQDLFYMAGVWNSWTDYTTGETKNSFGIITTEANAFMAKVHNVKKRMPTILNDELAAAWVTTSLNSNDIQTIASTQINAEEMQAHTVAKNFLQSSTPCEKVNYQIFTPQSLF